MPEKFTGKNKRDKAAGRRDSDVHVCVWHDIINEKNENCFDYIKGQMEKLELKFDNMVVALAAKIERSVTYKAAALITTIVMALLILFTGAVGTLANWQLSNLGNDIKSLVVTATSLEKKSDAASIENARIGAIQENVVATVRSIKDDLKNFENDMDTLKSQIAAKEFCADPQHAKDHEKGK